MIVLGCGARKQAQAAPALYLYTGPLFTSARSWALSVASCADIWILSAFHGLIPSSQVIEPYEQRLPPLHPGFAVMFRRPGWMTYTEPVHFVGGKPYLDLLRTAFPRAHSLAESLPPGRETRGIGAQRSWLAHNEGRLFA